LILNAGQQADSLEGEGRASAAHKRSAQLGVTWDRRVQAAASEAAVKVVLVLQNLVFLLFMTGLAWIFRCGPAGHVLVCGAHHSCRPAGELILRLQSS